jgi:hypothetical protein
MDPERHVYRISHLRRFVAQTKTTTTVAPSTKQATLIKRSIFGPPGYQMRPTAVPRLVQLSG